MTAAILMPFGGTPCEHRDRARDWIVARYRELHPEWALCFGESGEPWSKGAAVADALSKTTADVLVLADADSYVEAPVLADAVARCETGTAWVVPHRHVFRLTQEETERVYRGSIPRYERVVRTPYTGPAGGGITVLTRQSYEAVGGIDPRYFGWGGEDLSFGWSLCNLVGWYERLTGHLIHLWHPHPAPDLRGSPASEALVGRYKIHKRNPAGIRMLLEERERESSQASAPHGDSHPG